MINHDSTATWAYHDGTKHSAESVRSSRHYLDWANQPLPFKIYTTLEPIPLPRLFEASDVPAIDAIAGQVVVPTGERVPDLATIARLAYFSNGVTKLLRRRDGEKMPFRAAACTGALYHIELYLVCAELPDLAAGVYQYAAHDHSLRRLRSGDFRRVLVEASGDEPSVARAPAVVIFTSTFWRNSWKYQARAYRHSFWDTGTILANLFAVADASGVSTRLVVGFADDTVNRLVDVNPAKEAAICLVPLGVTDKGSAIAPVVEPLNLPTQPLSKREVDYPAIRAMHVASSLRTGAEVVAWRRAGGEKANSDKGERRGHPGTSPVRLSSLPIEDAIRRRGSTRRFAREPIEFEQLATMLESASRGTSSDLPASVEPLSDVYLIANAVDGLAAGSYVYDRASRRLAPLALGDFRDEAGYLDLGQELAADAAVNVYFLSDLRAVLGQLGNRGYRAAQLTAAIDAGKLYLAAYALQLGATGLTFFDDDVISFFSPHAAGKSVMFLMAIGRPWRATPGLQSLRSDQ
jgi:SagB-type dehydrogenase family enzyme